MQPIEYTLALAALLTEAGYPNRVVPPNDPALPLSKAPINRILIAKPLYVISLSLDNVRVLIRRHHVDVRYYRSDDYVPSNITISDPGCVKAIVNCIKRDQCLREQGLPPQDIELQ